jgi:cytidylate kinase
LEGSKSPNPKPFSPSDKEVLMAVITISRHYGAGGKTLGELISKNLGYSFFDNELIQMVAEKAKKSSDVVDSFEKESRGKFQKFISGMVPKTLVDRIRYGRGESIEEEIYVDLLHEIITKIADEGNAVIIGRASQYILKEYNDVFNILVIADRDDRVAFMEKNYELSREQADKVVTLDDKRRANLYRTFGKTDYDQLDLYHLVLNMSKVDLDRAAGLICELVSS